MTIIEKIKAEIERRKSLLTQHSKLTYDLILETFIKEYDDLLSFLSTLESECVKVKAESSVDKFILENCTHCTIEHCPGMKECYKSSNKQLQ